MFRIWLVGVLSNLGMLWILNKKGEAGSKSGSGDEKNSGGGEKKFTQADIDKVVLERLARERNKYQDYEDLKKFKMEHEKNTEEAKQKELEAAKKYEELKKGWLEKENNYKTALGEKDNAIK